MISNLYTVGTYGLGVFLITTDDGHILINTGLEDSTPLIRENIEAVGFKLEDVKILLTMQAHWDHTAALAEIKQITSAKMLATKDDARVLEDGGFSDAHFGGRESFKPVSVDQIIGEGEVIELGDTRLTVYEHPGHTEGSSSYSMRVRENGRDYNFVIANMGTINQGKKLLVDPTYQPRSGRHATNAFAKTRKYTQAPPHARGRIFNKYKVGKHFTLDIRDNSFSFEIDDTKVTAEPSGRCS